MREQADKIELIRQKIEDADAIVIGAGAGLSTAAGFTYSGDRFEKYFSDFGSAYGFSDMYSGGFYDYATLEEYWAYWSRYIYINRYQDVENGTYRKLYALVKDKDYFVLTTNVDHQFQKAGFAKERLFYTQGDYGLFQCSRPCHAKTYDNEKRILVPSPKVATYDLEPEMSAHMITASLVKEISLNREDLVVLNFANGDMVGHTGDYDAAIKAVETVDECIGKIFDNISLEEYTVIITADHGNAEVMKNKDGSINTSHTTNRVPFIITDKKLKLIDGKLGDIAPSILWIMGLDIPSEMTGNILIKNRKKR